MGNRVFCLEFTLQKHISLADFVVITVYFKPKTTAAWAVVCLESGKRDSSPRLRLGQSRAFHVTPAFLPEGCPSGASGSLVRAVVITI